MLADQRAENILEIINQREFVQVEELASQLGVSSMTIRRDLEKLSNMGLIQRKHGGAAALSVMRYENEYSDKKSVNLESKMKIAQSALSFIRDDTTIFLDGGTTTFQIAQQLRNRTGLTVITNDMMIALELSDRDVEIILVGGSVQKKTKTIIGPTAIDFIQQFRVCTAFLGTVSVNRDFDVLTPTVEKSFLKKAIMEISEQSYLVVDSSKFYSQSLHKWSSLSSFAGVITDKAFSRSEQAKLSEMHVHIISAR